MPTSTPNLSLLCLVQLLCGCPTLLFGKQASRHVKLCKHLEHNVMEMALDMSDKYEKHYYTGSI